MREKDLFTPSIQVRGQFPAHLREWVHLYGQGGMVDGELCNIL